MLHVVLQLRPIRDCIHCFLTEPMAVSRDCSHFLANVIDNSWVTSQHGDMVKTFSAHYNDIKCFFFRYEAVRRNIQQLVHLNYLTMSTTTATATGDIVEQNQGQNPSATAPDYAQLQAGDVQEVQPLSETVDLDRPMDDTDVRDALSGETPPSWDTGDLVENETPFGQSTDGIFQGGDSAQFGGS